MLCPKCQSEQKEGNTTCPTCGARLDGRHPLATFLKFVFFFAVLAGVLLLLGKFLKSDLEETIKGQLDALKNHELTKAYYAYTSKDFQEQMPLEKFKEFVRAYPILQDHTKVKYIDENVKNDRGEVVAKLFDETKEPDTEVIFSLSKEDNTWKIDDLELILAEQDPSNIITDFEMIKPIENQLKAIHEGNLSEAYDATSSEFQEEVPFDKFKEFVLATPILKEYENLEWVHQEKDQEGGLVSVLLTSGKDQLAIDYHMVLKDGHWKIVLIHPGVTVEKDKDNALTPSEKEDLLSTVRYQLQALQKKEIKQAYDHFMAKELQNETSYHQFVELTEAYPLLTQYVEANVHEPSIESGVSKVLVDLYGNNQGVSTIEYTLGLEDGAWKIWGIHFIKPHTKENSTAAAEVHGYNGYRSREILNSLQTFLDLIHHKEWAKAYTDYASSGFKRSFTLEKFTDFFQQHPEFSSSESSHFDKLIFTNRYATFSGELKLTDSKEMPVEFDLAPEEGQWKIVHIYALPVVDKTKTEENPPVGLNPPGKLGFSKAIFGTKVDSLGNILNASTQFKHDSGDIYIQLFVKSGVKGNPVELILKHLPSNTSMPLVKGKLTENGDDVLTFLFSPPPQGWPKGDYQLQVSSHDVSNNFTFQVNE